MKLNRKSFFAVLVFFLAPFFAFSKAETSEGLERWVSDFVDMRVLVSKTNYLSIDECIAQIEDFDSRYKDFYDTLNDVERQVVENFIYLEKYYYLCFDPVERDKQRDVFSNLRVKNQKLYKSIGKNNASKWFLTTYADVISCFVIFSYVDCIRYGTAVDDLYRQALELDDIAYAMEGLGQYYFFAPKIAGGSKKKCGQMLKRAVETARTDSEKFYADVLYGQYLFEMKDYEGCRKHMDAARAVCPESYYIKVAEKANANNMSFLEFNRSKFSFPKNYEDGD